MAQILVFGDSITDGSSDTEGGWADRLKRFLWVKNVKGEIAGNEFYWLYNLGISGNMTADVLKRIEVESVARKVGREDKGIVFVFAIGVNDTALVGRENPKNRVSDGAFSNNYQQLLTFAKQYTDNILCVGITPVDETRTCPIYDEFWYKNQRIQHFNELIRSTAQKNGVEFLELYNSFTATQNYVDLLDDGLHPNNEGHKWMYEYIRPYVMKMLEIT